MGMSEIKILEGGSTISGARIGLVAARFNSYIVEALIGGALETLQRHGVAERDIELARVPGAFEIPLMAQRMAAAKRYDAIICLGAVIRGGTPHFEYVAGECARGISAVALKYDMPVIFGVLTVDTMEQALERAGAHAGNKGADAALCAIEMVNVLRQLG